MLPPEVPEVLVYAGDTCSFHSYTFQDSLEGWTGWSAQWRSRAESSDFVELDVDDSLALSDGIITVSGSAADTAQMLTAGIWDLQSTNGIIVKTWVRGRTRLTKDVTRIG